MGRALDIQHGIGQLRPDTDPASIAFAVGASRRSLRLQFDEPLPEETLVATADVLRLHPEVPLRAYGREVDPGLSWLSGLEHVQHLSLELWHTTSFDRLAGLPDLRSLSLGQTASTRPSLSFLRELPRLETLWVEAHDHDFDAVGDVAGLKQLHLRVPRIKSLEALKGHAGIQVFTMNFGGVRDLAPLADIPHLRGLELYQVRNLDTDDLEALSGCDALEAVSLGALRNVASLQDLARGSRSTLRFLNLERLTNLATLADLTMCDRLEQLGLYESRPLDRRLDVLLQCPSLTHLITSDSYPKDQLDAMRNGFTGETLQLRGESVRGDLANVAVRWRAPVQGQLVGLVE